MDLEVLTDLDTVKREPEESSPSRLWGGKIVTNLDLVLSHFLNHTAAGISADLPLAGFGLRISVERVPSS